MALSVSDMFASLSVETRHWPHTHTLFARLVLLQRRWLAVVDHGGRSSGGRRPAGRPGSETAAWGSGSGSAEAEMVKVGNPCGKVGDAGAARLRGVALTAEAADVTCSSQPPSWTEEGLRGLHKIHL